MRLFLLILFLNVSFTLRSQSVPANLFRNVNSGYDEQNPVLSPDGNTLLFTISNHPDNTGGKRDPGDIWLSRIEGSEWSAPVHGGSLLNDKAYNAVAGFSADGNQLFLHGHYGHSGNIAKSQGISVSRNNGAGWSRPENIRIPYFLNKSGILCGSVSADNEVFVFSAESYGTYGVDDIYVSLKHQGNWSEPKNLGSVINTQFQELSPSLSDDKKTLYFSSNGRKGNGSFDIYSATRLDDSWTNWSAPENIGQHINSEGRELFFRAYPDRGFMLYTTTRSSDGYGDVKIFVPSDPLPLNDSAIYASLDPVKPQEKTHPVVEESVSGTGDVTTVEIIEETPVEKHREVKVYGRISDAKTGQTIPAKISFSSPAIAERNIVSGDQGYAMQVPASDYAIKIEANGYVSTLENLDINAFEMSVLEMNFKLQPVEVGTTVNLKNVLFAQAKTDVLPESFPELDLVISFLKNNPTVRIELMGHTDGRGVHADNVRLSQQRVNKVKEYLVSRGIEARRISGKGFGGSKPIASNDTEESRRMNRRVEFVIKKF